MELDTNMFLYIHTLYLVGLSRVLKLSLPLPLRFLEDLILPTLREILGPISLKDQHIDFKIIRKNTFEHNSFQFSFFIRPSLNLSC